MPSLAEHGNWYAKQWWHGWRARDVLDTPPIMARDDGVLIFSMIGTRVLLPYLVAVKTLHAALGRGRIALLDDGTLTDADRRVIAAHLGDPVIRSIHDVDTGPCPRGGTWERLLTILDLRAHDYVIQLDSDTLSFGDMPEVRAAIDAGRSFTLLGEAAARLLPVDDFVAGLAPRGQDGGRLHVQHAIERAMDQVRIPTHARLRYVRGCSGFAGFTPSAEARTLAEAFAREGARLLGGDHWAQWGSEQVTSNFVIANDADPLMLPYARYLNFWNQRLPDDRRLVHFIGTCRFDGMTYLDATRDAIRRLATTRANPGGSSR